MNEILIKANGAPTSNFMEVAKQAYQWTSGKKILTCPISVTIELYFDKPRIANIVGIESSVLVNLRGVVFAKETQIHRIDVVRYVSDKPCTVVTIRKVDE